MLIARHAGRFFSGHPLAHLLGVRMAGILKIGR
jgi:hypothetical protein